MTLASELAGLVVLQQYSDLPPKAIDYAEMLIASTVASASLGSTIGSTKIIRALEVERGGAPEATVWFAPAQKLPMAAAARINALSSDAAASDDSHLDFIIHHGTTVCASSLAVAEKTDASGKEVLAAIVLGYEVTSRLIGALQFPFKDKGFHGCVVASFSGAVAAARLMGLTQDQTTHAIAITATSMGGLSAAANTSWAREYHAGQAAMQGVNAALAAGRGYTAEAEILELKKGFLEVHGSNPDRASITRDLGKQWSILRDMGIKLVPGGHPNHAVAEAAANAARMGNVAPEEVEEVTISRPGYQGFANPHMPTDLIGIAHSAMYFAAAGVVDKDYTWVHAFEEKINNPTIRSMLGKVRMVAPPEKDLDKFKAGAIVTIRMRDGRSFMSTVYAPRGAAVLGIAWADVEAKYRALVPYAALSGNNLEASLAVIRNFRQVQRVTELVDLLR
ncbi:MmgE/PrpD family protein [Polaromonas sp. P1(28)-13]|nr:MmgE/PrpD family protein [Polaromonas sp. P1(28)-13]